MKTCAVAVVLLSCLSFGLSAPLSQCESLVKPITVTKEQMLGKWVYIGGSSKLPGSRSFVHTISSTWLDISATSQNNILNILQNQKIFEECVSLTYNVTFENSMMLIEQPFYLKEVYLPTDCSNCLVVLEDIVHGSDTYRSLLLLSKSTTVSSADVEMLKRQADCLKMPSVLMMDTKEGACPDDIKSSEGLAAFNEILEQKTALRVVSFLDVIFDWFVN